LPYASAEGDEKKKKKKIVSMSVVRDAGRDQISRRGSHYIEIKNRMKETILGGKKNPSKKGSEITEGNSSYGSGVSESRKGKGNPHRVRGSHQTSLSFVKQLRKGESAAIAIREGL